MIEYRCPLCHQSHVAPNVLCCPFCNKGLTNATDEFAKKHIAKCSYYLNPYRYSDRKSGRPKKTEYPRPE